MANGPMLKVRKDLNNLIQVYQSVCFIESDTNMVIINSSKIDTILMEFG